MDEELQNKLCFMLGWKIQEHNTTKVNGLETQLLKIKLRKEIKAILIILEFNFIDNYLIRILI